MYPPVKTYRFTGEVFTVGVRIYSPEKTLPDCFKFRNKVGLDTVIEVMRFYRERKKKSK